MPEYTSGQKKRGSVVILPSSDDRNRGDQALVWETRSVSQAAGYTGKHYMLAEPTRGAAQSEAEGFGVLSPLLRHPGTRYAPKSNINYGVMLTLAWGLVAILDTLRCLALLTPIGRQILRHFLDSRSRETLRIIGEADVCFVKGGGFIHSTNSPTDPYRAFFSLFHVMLAQSMGKKVLVMPNSFGPLKGMLYRAIVRRTLHRCVLVTTRESISGDALSGLGVDSETFADLAFGLDSRAGASLEIRDFRGEFPDRPIVGITVRPYRFPYSADPAKAYASYVDETAKFVEKLYRDGFLPVFIEHVTSEGAHENDRKAIDDVVSRLGDCEFKVVSQPGYNCREMKDIYGQCDYVVGTRFHSVIFSLSEGVPAVAIAYGGNKGLGIMADAGMRDYVVGIEEATSESLWLAFRKMVDDPEIDAKISRLQRKTRLDRARLVERVVSG